MGGTPALASSSAFTLVLRACLRPQKNSLGREDPPKGEGHPDSITSDLHSCSHNQDSTTMGRTDRQKDRLESSPPLALRLPLSDLNSLWFNPHRQVRIKFKTGFSRSPATAGREPAPRLVSTRPRGGGRAPFAFIFLLPLKWAHFTSRLPSPPPRPLLGSPLLSPLLAPDPSLLGKTHPHTTPPS